MDPWQEDMRIVEESRRSRMFFEVVAIIFSILAAFAIDAAWDLRQLRMEERETLHALRRDFLANRTAVGQVLEIHRARADFHAWFAGATSEEIRNLSADSTTLLYTRLYAPASFDAVRGTVDALIGAGSLGLIHDRDLREGLMTFVRQVEDLEEERESMLSAGVAVLEGVIPHGGPWYAGFEGTSLPVVTPADLAAIHRDRELMGKIHLSHHWSRVYSSELSELAGLIDQIIDLAEAR